MEAVFMNFLFETTKVLDMFTSFIWNEKYCGYGDFEIRLPMTDGAIVGIYEGAYVSIKESEHLMVVEGINIKTSLEEGNYLVVSGRSLESILERRIVYEDTILSGNIQNCLLRILNANIINPENANRAVKGLTFVFNNDPDISTIEIEREVKAGENLYDVVYDICEAAHLGFKIVPDEAGCTYFTVYKGLDRSYSQEKNPWVVFSPKFENLKSSEMDLNTEDLKNCIIARSEYTESKVNKQGEDFDRLIAEKEGMVLIVSTKNESEGTTEEPETITHRIEIIIGNENKDLDRREIFQNSREVPETINEEEFGKASDRVNARDYMEKQIVGYDSHMRPEDVSYHYTPTPKGHYEFQNRWMNPGDEGYIPEMAGVGQLTTEKVWVPGATPEEAAAIQEKNDRAYQEGVRKWEQKHAIWGWVFVDRAGYEAALKKAQAEIDAEIAAAKQLAFDTTEGLIRGNAEDELSKHLTISSFEGELDPSVQYVYGRDYSVGDLVQIVNEFDFQAVTRVVSMMFSEEEGVGFIARPSFESDDKAVFEI